MLSKMQAAKHDMPSSYERHLDPDDRRRGMTQASKRAQFLNQLSDSTIHSVSPPNSLPDQWNLAQLATSPHQEYRHKRIQAPIAISSDEEATIGNISDLIDDDLETDIDAWSSTLTPNPAIRDAAAMPEKAYQNSAENELPGFDTLLHLATENKNAADSRLGATVVAGSGSRRGRRRVIQDDSDDE